ncbi:DNA replication protein [Tardiphaga sp. vice352]|uniref:DUF6456 domain-containing protein n=1 Tax=unclassified Tardiphaga TaxID=2631404 RepID=UPI00116418A6|nr:MULTISPECIES: DUF6456 domain-containing protein [unclassified Tardiphaga]QDM21563.1 DNA replication protein [Tardiphaga sp. vice154]QDM26751.1 DNA replication protein [Tardiphaga sp. vice304]QDM31813.1 DNA replication protein [Tardiphaga sp. vice352]
MKASRPPKRPSETIDPQRARHLSLETRQILTEDGVAAVLVNDSESPLAWLARRKGRDGRAMISPHQFIAGEKLRADFTRGNLAPRMTANWDAPGGRPRGSGASPAEMTDVMVTSRQRLSQAMEACGPEFSGVLMDVCCFLRGLEDVERERGWPARSAKIVLQLGLDRLARHYGFAAETRGRGAKLRTWLADDVAFES